MSLTLERLREVLSYDPITGTFTWIVSSRRIAQGELAGTVSALGYRRIGIDGKQYRAHRLAWFWTHGRWPQFEIDHIDRDRLNNRIANLRDIPHALNDQNKSVGYIEGLEFIAAVNIDGETKVIGMFKTLGASTRALKAARLSFKESRKKKAPESCVSEAF